MKKLLSLLLALAMVFTLAACGGKDDDDKKSKKDEDEDSIAGKYMLVSVEIDGEELDEDDMIDEFGKDSYIKIEDDGTATMKIDGEKMDMEWEDDEIWEADDEDNVFEIKIKKNKVTITAEEDGEEMVLTFEKEEDEDNDKDEDEDKKGNKKDEDEDKKDNKKEEEDKRTEQKETTDVDEYEYPEYTYPEYEYPEYTYPEYEYPEYEYPEYAYPTEEETYYFYSMTMDGQTVYMEDLAAQIGEDAAAAYLYLEITGSYTATLWSNGQATDMEFDGEYMWPEEDPDDIAYCEFSGDYVTITAEDYELILAK